MTTTSVPSLVRGLVAAATALAVLAIASAGGCGSSEQFDKSVDYSPESLAQELAFRYQELTPSARVAKKRRDAPRGKQGDPLKSHDEQSQVKAQAKEATKKAPAENLDDVLDEIEAKAAKITDHPRAQVFQKMADAIDKEAALDPADRQTLADKLKEMGKN